MTSREAKHQASLSVWQGNVAECRSSGLSVRQWCKENQVSPQTYYQWEIEVLEHASKEQAAFAEVPLKNKSRFPGGCYAAKWDAVRGCLPRSGRGNIGGHLQDAVPDKSVSNRPIPVLRQEAGPHQGAVLGG